MLIRKDDSPMFSLKDAILLDINKIITTNSMNNAVRKQSNTTTLLLTSSIPMALYSPQPTIYK